VEWRLPNACPSGFEMRLTSRSLKDWTEDKMLSSTGGHFLAWVPFSCGAAEYISLLVNKGHDKGEIDASSSGQEHPLRDLSCCLWASR
jgi:hypothetical protein